MRRKHQYRRNTVRDENSYAFAFSFEKVCIPSPLPLAAAMLPSVSMRSVIASQLERQREGSNVPFVDGIVADVFGCHPNNLAYAVRLRAKAWMTEQQP